MAFLKIKIKKINFYCEEPQLYVTAGCTLEIHYDHPAVIPVMASREPQIQCVRVHGH